MGNGGADILACPPVRKRRGADAAKATSRITTRCSGINDCG